MCLKMPSPQLSGAGSSQVQITRQEVVCSFQRRTLEYEQPQHRSKSLLLSLSDDDVHCHPHQDTQKSPPVLIPF